MLKKSLIASAILMIVSNSAFSHPDYKNEKAMPVEEAPIASTATGSEGVPYVGVGIGEQLKGTKYHFLGSLFGGYGKKIGSAQNIYLGGEFFTEYLDHSNYALGASFIPGYMFTQDTMGYGRVGVKATRNTGTHTTNTNAQLGAGLQTAVSANWDVRGEYVYTFAGTNQVNLGLLYKFK